MSKNGNDESHAASAAARSAARQAILEAIAERRAANELCVLAVYPATRAIPVRV